MAEQTKRSASQRSQRPLMTPQEQQPTFDGMWTNLVNKFVGTPSSTVRNNHMVEELGRQMHKGFNKRDQSELEHNRVKLENNKLKSENGQLKSERDRLKSERESLKSEREQLLSALATQKNETNAIKNKLNQTEAKLEQAQAKRKELEVALKDQVEETKAAKTKHNEVFKTYKRALSQDNTRLLNANSMNDVLTKKIAALDEVNMKLKASLDGAHAQIFSLQPYRQDLTPDQAGPEFDAIVFNVENWVEQLLSPILEDADLMASLAGVEDHLLCCMSFGSQRSYRPNDILRACATPDTEVDILVAIMMRWLGEHIFEVELPGLDDSFVSHLGMIQHSLEHSVEPKRDLRTLRNWKAETINAILQHPESQRKQSNYAGALVEHLQGQFYLFFDMHETVEKEHLHISLLKNIIQPAMGLCSKIKSSISEYFLEDLQYLCSEMYASDRLITDLLAQRVQCLDIMRNRKPIAIEKMSPKPTEMDLHYNLSTVLTTVPALCVRHFRAGQTDQSNDKPIVVRPRRVLVKYGELEEKKNFLESSKVTAFRDILYPRPPM